MAKPQVQYARIHLLPAKEAPYVVVIRRKPSRKVHIMRWNTQTDEIEHGSWFSGRIYEMRSDVSFDGQWMVYLAMGGNGGTWTGICKPPFLKTLVDWENCGAYHGGGFFDQRNRLRANAGHSLSMMESALISAGTAVPFMTTEIDYLHGTEDDNVLYQRLERDGYEAVGKRNYDALPRYGYALSIDGTYWRCQPTPKHLPMEVTSVGYFRKRSSVFHFDLPDKPDLLGYGVTWAAYDCLGQLVVARGGALERYTLKSLEQGLPRFRLDLEDLTPPAPPIDKDE